MPYESRWVDPAVFLLYKNVYIYHTYNDDNIHDRRTYWYTWNERCVNDDDTEFDIRELALLIGGYHKYEDKTIAETHKNILKEAIDRGILTDVGIDYSATGDDTP